MQQLINILWSWIKSFFIALGDFFLDLLVTIINLILGFIAFLIKFLASIFPSISIGLDLVNQFATPHQAICWINWIFPVDVLIICITFFVSALIFKFTYGFILRLVKLIA